MGWKANNVGSTRSSLSVLSAFMDLVLDTGNTNSSRIAALSDFAQIARLAIMQAIWVDVLSPKTHRSK
jgi:hypothetical protein